MKILVPIKRVADPDNADKISIAADGSAILSEGLEWKINPYDEYALEAALRLNENGATKERIGEITVACLGPSDSTQTLRQALAMGADRGILVECDDMALDSWSCAHALKALVAKEEPDLVLMGKITVDSDSNAVGQTLAELLQWPMATMAMHIRKQSDTQLQVGRETDLGILSLQLSLPAIITAADRIIHPESVKNGLTPDDFRYPEAEGGRYASLKGIMAAKKKSIDTMQLSDLGDSAALTQYVSFAKPPTRSGTTVFVQSADELVQKLRQDAKVL